MLTIYYCPSDNGVEAWTGTPDGPDPDHPWWWECRNPACGCDGLVVRNGLVPSTMSQLAAEWVRVPRTRPKRLD